MAVTALAIDSVASKVQGGLRKSSASCSLEIKLAMTSK